MKKVDLSFQSCQSTYLESKVIIFSAPLDATTSYRPGTRFAGNHIRIDSIGIEWYSPYRNLSLKAFDTCDIGDLEMPVGDVNGALDVIYKTTKKIIEDDKKPMMIGGEHLVTYPVVKALLEKHPNLHLIHLDAHTDLRDEFLGMKLSHATVIRRCYEAGAKVYSFGIRSGDQHEFEWAKKHIYLRKYDLNTLEETIDQIKDEPVYITIDLDILDPAYFPGTGTPEPGGITYKELLGALDLLSELNHIVGADIVELNPLLDPSGASTMAAIKTLRELILILHQ